MFGTGSNGCRGWPEWLTMGGDCVTAVTVRTAYADAVVTYLAFAVDKAPTLVVRSVSWINDRGAFREVFARQAIPMTWDFAEANPFSGRGGDWSLFDRQDPHGRGMPVLLAGSRQTAQRDARARIAEVGQAVSCRPTLRTTTTFPTPTCRTSSTSGCDEISRMCGQTSAQRC